MSKKIITASIVAVLLFMTVLISSIFVIGRQKNINEDQEESKQTQSYSQNKYPLESMGDTTPDVYIPPVIGTEDTSDSIVKDEIILDVSGMVRDPNPSIIDSKIEYGTKEIETNVE